MIVHGTKAIPQERVQQRAIVQADGFPVVASINIVIVYRQITHVYAFVQRCRTTVLGTSGSESQPFPLAYHKQQFPVHKGKGH